MRYHKRVQLVATFVASVGAFVVLQGTARADTATTLPAQQSTTAAPDGAEVSAPGNSSGNSQSTVAQGTGQGVSGSHDGTLPPEGSSDAPSKATPDNSTKAPASGDAKPQETANLPATAPSDGIAVPVVVTTPDRSVHSNTSVTQQQPTSITMANQSQSVRPAIILPIQPTIRSYAISDAGDLAWSLPSVPVSAKQPVPAKSNGAMGNLRLILAGVVVPSMIALTDWASFAGLIVALVALGGLLLGSLYTFSYGLWLKRGGFVNAARSDAPPALATSSLFATPQLLGYVTMPPRRHNPIFVVSDIKFPINEFLFTTLSERRTCI